MLLLLFGCLCDTTYEQAAGVQVSQGEILAFFVGLSGMLYYKFALWKTKRPPQKKIAKILASPSNYPHNNDII